MGGWGLIIAGLVMLLIYWPIGIILLIIGFILLAVGQGKKAQKEKKEVRVPCPFCSESILKTAKICPFCKSSVEEQLAKVVNEDELRLRLKELENRLYNYHWIQKKEDIEKEIKELRRQLENSNSGR